MLMPKHNYVPSTHDDVCWRCGKGYYDEKAHGVVMKLIKQMQHKRGT